LQVVGTVSNTGFVWKNGAMTDLNSLISDGRVGTQSANAINTRGQIVGVAYIPVGKGEHQLHAYLITPN
jgi:uncharacterized membrane protein